MEKNTLRVTIPLNITIEIGHATNENPRTILGAERSRPEDNEAPPVSEAEILSQARKAFEKTEGFVSVRLGYKFENGWITKKRALVVTVKERKSVAELNKTANSRLPDNWGNYPVDITTPTIQQLLRESTKLHRTNQFVEPESRYFPPDDIELTTINSEMRVIASVSPEEGWNQLENFLIPTKNTLTIAMYDFGAPHIVDTISALADRSGFDKFLLTLQPGESVGDGAKKKDYRDKETVDKFKEAFGNKFDMSWVHIGSVNGWVNSSYHIKVAVRDSKALFLSSGNFQSSNQPQVKASDTAAYLLRTFNREWHAVVENEELATVFEKFIKHDLKNNRPDAREAMIEQQDLYLLTPKFAAVEGEAVAKEKFPVFDEYGTFTVTPILSPDNYFEKVLALVKSAEEQLLIQNQTFNCPKPDHAALQELVAAVLEKQQAGLDVRIIFRTMYSATTRENLEGLVDMGFDPSCFKVHNRMHTKGIVVDGKKVLLGSQNWSNDGVSVNRDASLLFENAPLASWFRQIFEHDWKNVAWQFVGRESGTASIVGREAPVPATMDRFPLGDLLEIL